MDIILNIIEFLSQGVKIIPFYLYILFGHVLLIDFFLNKKEDFHKYLQKNKKIARSLFHTDLFSWMAIIVVYHNSHNMQYKWVIITYLFIVSIMLLTWMRSWIVYRIND